MGYHCGLISLDNICQTSEAIDELPDTAMTEIAINIAVQALQGRNCWLCRERVISLAKHMFGTAVNRYGIDLFRSSELLK